MPVPPGTPVGDAAMFVTAVLLVPLLAVWPPANWFPLPWTIVFVMSTGSFGSGSAPHRAPVDVVDHVHGVVLPIGAGNAEEHARPAPEAEPALARERTTLELARELAPKTNSLPGVNAFIITPPSLGQGFRERPLNFVIQTSDSYENLNGMVRQMLDEIAKNPGIVSPDADLRLNKPELRIEVDREKAADLGVSVEVVAKALETMLGGRIVTRYKRDAEQYDVIVQTEARSRTTPEEIDGINVRGRGDTMIPLSALVKVREVTQAQHKIGEHTRSAVDAVNRARQSFGLVPLDEVFESLVKHRQPLSSAAGAAVSSAAAAVSSPATSASPSRGVEKERRDGTPGDRAAIRPRGGQSDRRADGRQAASAL